MNKINLKEEFLKQRNVLKEYIIREASTLIKNSLFSLNEFNDSTNIAFYISKGSEVCTKEMILNAQKINKKIFIPYINKTNSMKLSELKNYDNLKEGYFGVLEPLNPKPYPSNKIELIIIPGIVFDKKGYRLGYGMGYYDKFLKGLKTTKVGLAFDFQVIESIPGEPHDMKMDYIITNKKIITCKDD